MIKLLHTADLHLGVNGHGRVNPATGLHERLEDFLATLDQMVTYAIKEDVDAFLVAGDIYHTKAPDAGVQAAFATRVRQLTAAGIAVLLLVGNHDAVGRANAANPLDIYAALEMPGVTVMRTPKLYVVETRRGLLQVAALPHLSASVLEAKRTELAESRVDSWAEMAATLAAMAERLEAEVDFTLPAVLTAHWSIDVAEAGSEGQMMLGRGVTLPLSALQLPGFQYVAMGHIHKPQHWGREGYPLVVYPGSPDRVDFGEERDEKRFWVVHLTAGCDPVWFHVPLTVRPFLTIDVDLVGVEDPTNVLALAILSHMAGIPGAIVRLRFRIEADRASQVDEALVREALAAARHVLWRPDLVPAEARVRHPEVAVSVAADPLSALDSFIDVTPELADRRAALRAAATTLLAELAGLDAATPAHEVLA